MPLVQSLKEFNGYYYIDKQIMNREEMVKYFAKHIRSGKVFRVGAEYEATAKALINAGLVSHKGKINKYVLERFIKPKYTGVNNGQGIDIS